MKAEPEKARVIALLTDCKSALERLKEALSLPPTPIHKDATIQRFEFTFELGWKLMQAVNRYLGFESYGPRDSIRTAAKAALITVPDIWLELLEARNMTTHVYKERAADQIYATVPKLADVLPELLTGADRILRDV